MYDERIAKANPVRTTFLIQLLLFALAAHSHFEFIVSPKESRKTNEIFLETLRNLKVCEDHNHRTGYQWSTVLIREIFVLAARPRRYTSTRTFTRSRLCLTMDGLELKVFTILGRLIVTALDLWLQKS